MNLSTKRFRRNISLIGPPGSGKGSYGRPLGRSLGIPLITVSDVQRQFRPNVNLSSGQLVKDHVVSEALMERMEWSLKKEETMGSTKCGYLLDGFPRTLDQVHLMNETWPSRHAVQAVVCLDVPDHVCETKMLGRRICRKCGGNFNVNGVLDSNWDLPPTLPTESDRDKCQKYDCNQNTDWKIRDDDLPSIVKERIQLYHHHIDPILNYFEKKQRLFKFTPYKGYDDIPKFEATLCNWLIELENRDDLIIP